MFMVPAQDPVAIDLFKQRLIEDPVLNTAASLASSKSAILNDGHTTSEFKTATIKQIDPKLEMYIKKLKQLPPGLSVNADAQQERKALADQEEDLSTSVEQKLLKRLLHKEPRRPVKKAPASQRIPAPVVKKTPVVTMPVQATPPPPPPLPPPQTITPPPSPVSKRKSSWDELPFADGGNEPDFQDALTKTMKKIKRTPQAVKNLRRAKRWESWVPTGKRKVRRRGQSRSRSVLKTLWSAAKDLVSAGASAAAGGGRTKRRRTRKKKGLLGTAGSLAKQLIFDD